MVENSKNESIMMMMMGTDERDDVFICLAGLNSSS